MAPAISASFGVGMPSGASIPPPGAAPMLNGMSSSLMSGMGIGPGGALGFGGGGGGGVCGGGCGLPMAGGTGGSPPFPPSYGVLPGLAGGIPRLPSGLPAPLGGGSLPHELGDNGTVRNGTQMAAALEMQQKGRMGAGPMAMGAVAPPFMPGCGGAPACASSAGCGPSPLLRPNGHPGLAPPIGPSGGNRPIGLPLLLSADDGSMQPRRRGDSRNHDECGGGMV